MPKIVRLALLFLFTVGLSASTGSPSVFLYEGFRTLENWRQYKFPKVDRLSHYSVVEVNGDTVLKAGSENSASALILKKTFKVDSFPILKWRWKVDNIYEKGDEVTKAGDDYALRIYVNFKYEPEYASFLDRTKYTMAKAIFGEYPPHSALSYIWANQIHEKRILPNPFQEEKTKMVIVRQGTTHVGKWQTEQVNILDDYRDAFGRAPPEVASLAIMNDSDGTGELSTAYLDFIRILSDPEDGN